MILAKIKLHGVQVTKVIALKSGLNNIYHIVQKLVIHVYINAKLKTMPQLLFAKAYHQLIAILLQMLSKMLGCNKIVLSLVIIVMNHQKLNTMISIPIIQIVDLTFLIKDNVVLAGLTLELLNSVTDFAKTELMLEIIQHLLLFNIHLIQLLNVILMVQIIMGVMEVP